MWTPMREGEYDRASHNPGRESWTMVIQEIIQLTNQNGPLPTPHSVSNTIPYFEASYFVQGQLSS